MNESDLLMMSLPPLLLLIGRYHNISPLNYIEAEPSFVKVEILQINLGGVVSWKSTAHVPPAEGTVPKSASSYHI